MRPLVVFVFLFHAARLLLVLVFHLKLRYNVQAALLRRDLLAGGFLDNRVIPLGEFGLLFSAGLIPLINILIGLKVGSELGSLLQKFKE